MNDILLGLQFIEDALDILRLLFAETGDIKTAHVIINLVETKNHIRCFMHERTDIMPDTDVIVIDKEKMQVDRSTKLGQAFEKMQQSAGDQKDSAMGNLMNQILAYTEASLVIDETIIDPAKKEDMLGKLRSKMGE